MAQIYANLMVKKIIYLHLLGSIKLLLRDHVWMACINIFQKEKLRNGTNLCLIGLHKKLNGKYLYKKGIIQQRIYINTKKSQMKLENSLYLYR